MADKDKKEEKKVENKEHGKISILENNADPGKSKEAEASRRRAPKKKIPEEIGVLLGLVLIFGVFAFICYQNGKPQFYSPENLINIARQVSMIVIVAVGMTFVIISGGIDLSVGSTVAFSGVITAFTISTYTGNTFLGVIAGLLMGLLVGVFNGFVVANFNVPPFIVTLATMIGVRGLAFIACGGSPIDIEGGLLELGSGRIANIPYPVIIMVLVILGGWYLANNLKIGRYIYALGGNEEAARLSGINVKKLKIFIFGLSGTLAALAGIINAGRLGSGDPKEGELFELDAIAAAVVGGTSLSGGRGKIIGTVLGALIIGVIKNGLDILGVESYTQMVIKGAVILLAVLIDQIRKNEDARIFAIKCSPSIIGIIAGVVLYRATFPSIGFLPAMIMAIAVLIGTGYLGYKVIDKTVYRKDQHNPSPV
ncbi:MAG: ABC transporter permease [Vulcanimicrobiota bacterium]